MKKVLVILGQHRSGTSMLSGSLSLMGGWLGKNYEFGANQYNSKGYFENRWTSVYNDKALASINCSWCNVENIKNNVTEQTVSVGLVEELKSHLEIDLNHLPEDKFYVIKDPRISLILPIYLRAFKELNIEAKFIFSDRKTSEILNSISHRDGKRPDTKFNNISVIQNAINKHRELAKKHLPEKGVMWTSTFYNMFYSPEKYLKYLKNYLDLPLDVSDEAFKRVDEFIDKGMKNQNGEKNCKILTASLELEDGNKLNSFKKLIEHERNLNAGEFIETLILNYNISDTSEAKKFLNEIDGTPTRSGVIKVVNVPLENSSNSLHSVFNYSYNLFKDVYSYWYFAKEDVQEKNGYFSDYIKQLENDKSLTHINRFIHIERLKEIHNNQGIISSIEFEPGVKKPLTNRSSDYPVKLSICIPTYNKVGAKHNTEYNNITMLLDLFESIEKQSFKDYETIISDHSTDDSVLEVCNQWKERLNISYHRYKENYGSCEANLNNAMKKAKGEYIKPMLQDDYMHTEHALQRQVEALDLGKHKWVASGCWHINENNKKNLYSPHPPEFKNPEKFLSGGNVVGSPSVVMHVNDGKLYDINLIWLMDSDFYYLLFKDYDVPYLIGDLDFISRLRSDGISNTMLSGAIKDEEIEYLKDKHIKNIVINRIVDGKKYPNMKNRISSFKF